MKTFTPLFWIAGLAAIIAVVIAICSGHSAATGLHENVEPHGRPGAVLFFYWWGGIIAAGSPLIYIYLWRKTRGTRLENDEGF